MKKTACPDCGVENEEHLPDRKRDRARRCKDCNKKAVNERNRNDPARRLQRRFAYDAKNWWPGLKKIATKQIVRQVVENCNSKCAISGETNMELLKIVPKTATPPTGSQDLMLKCIRLAKQSSTSSHTGPQPPQVDELE